jgi:hypothetical protein
MFAIRTVFCASLLALPAFSSSPLTSQGTFQLTSVNVAPGGTWKLNRDIEFLFNDPLDLPSVPPTPAPPRAPPQLELWLEGC